LPLKFAEVFVALGVLRQALYTRTRTRTRTDTTKSSQRWFVLERN